MFGVAPNDPLLDAIRANPSLAIGMIAAGVTVARLITVSHYQPETALGLLAAGGIGTLVMAFAVTVVPWLAPLAAVTIFRFAGDLYNEGRRAVLTFTTALVVAEIALLTSPIWVIAAVLLLEAVLTAIEAWSRRRVLKKYGPGGVWRRDHPFVRYALPFVFALMAQLAVGQPWFPPETVVLSDGSSFLGYVVAEDARWTTVLQESDRHLRRLPADLIATRTICTRRVWFDSALGDLARRTPGYPSCEP
jgi:hypothetical protein